MPTKPRRAKAQGPLRRHALLVVAVTLFWAAMDEPTKWTLAPVLVWLLTAVAVAFLACAVIALADPGAMLVIKVWPRRPPPPPEASEP
jgi:hypothetical protein